MEINTSDLLKEIKHLDSAIHRWENLQLNLYHQLDKALEDWQDSDSIHFKEKISLEKNNLEKVLNQVKSLSSFYQYLYYSYNKLGQNIYCDIESRRLLLEKINTYSNNLKSIWRKFDDFDINFSYPEKESIMEIKNKLGAQLKKLEELNKIVTRFLNQVEEIEREVSVRLSKFREILVQDFENIE